MTKINPHIFRAYDIRGIADGVNPDLTEETVYLIAKGTATYLKEKYDTKNMAVGRDVRLTGEKLQNAYIKGLLECGLDVTDIGIVTSPMVYWSVCALTFDSGTNITASHNPKQYNGIKIVTKNAHSICGDELQEILKIVESGNFATGDGKLTKVDFTEKYIADITSKVHLSRSLKVAIDCGNGAAGIFAQTILEKIGCKVLPLYCEPDGNFPHHEANPEELHNMLDLIELVKKEKADLGIGFDGDGDRVGVVDEQGKMYSSDFMLLLLVRDLVTKLKNPQVVFDIKVSQVIINEMANLGAIPIMSKTGHSFIEAKMKELNAPLAGEVSGHLFFGHEYYGFDDAFLGACKIIEIVANADQPLSQMFNNLPQTFMTPEFKATCADDKKFEIVQKISDHFSKIYPSITIDGIRINFDNLSWGAIRASNTTPCLTLRFEAPTKERLKEIQKIMAEEIKKYPEVNLDWYSI